MKVVTIIAILGCFFLAGCRATPPEPVRETVLVVVEQPQVASTPYPTFTARPPLPTLVPLPPMPTYTAYPPLPTYTPYPPLATYTPAPTYTAYPTYTSPPIVSATQATPDASQYLGVEQEGGKLGAIWSLADIRHRSYADHLRIVWEMTEPGDHVPLYRIEEVDNSEEPHPGGEDPSWGKARIDLVLSDVYAYGYPLEDQVPIVFDDDPIVTRIGQYPTFSDAHLGFTIGLRQPAAFRVYELLDPVRLVLDVLYSMPQP